MASQPAGHDPATDASGARPGVNADAPLTLQVEVVYAQAQHQEVVRLDLVAGSTLQQALDASGLLQKYPDIDLARNKLGIFGKLCKPDAVLRDHDRIEIYRPLLADPKEVRKQRAAERQSAGKSAPQ